MHISYDANVFEAVHSQDYLPEYIANSLAIQNELQQTDKSNQEYLYTSEKDMISKSHVIQNLHRMGHILFNNSNSTNTCLHIKDKGGLAATFWVHDFYFLHDSPVLYKALHPTNINAFVLRELESLPQADTHWTVDDHGKYHIRLSVPSVIGFEELLRWIYTRDDVKWLHTMSQSNFDSIMENVAFLRLSQDAYYVMAEFYEDNI